ncbi:hypothetical protein [Kutzneria albida]|uniref:hypothetical protein n=1 Tax=Kutzneria albida TaxID=43357 RepID=UPI00046CFAF5|nr:hypothetical protein [Kutzneria albida]
MEPVILAELEHAEARKLIGRGVEPREAARRAQHLQVLPPCQFAANTVAVNRTRALAAVAVIAGRRPDGNAAEVLHRLGARYRMERVVDLLRPFVGSG